MNATKAQELPNICSKILGCIVGAAVGDALGAPNEFNTKRQTYTQLNKAYNGKWTDDTQLSLLVLESLKTCHNTPKDNGNGKREFLKFKIAMALALGNWHDHPLGGHRAPGNACVQAANEYKLGNSCTWQPSRTAYGSGAVMRAHVHGAVLPPKRAFAMAVEDSLLTHGALAAKAAGKWAMTISHIIRDPHPHQLRDNEAAYATHKAACNMFDGFQGWTSASAYKACSNMFFKSNRAWPLVYLAAGSTGDSDTLGSMMGAAIGAAYGIEAIPARLLNKLENPDAIFKAAWDACAIAALTMTNPKHWETV